MLNQIRKFVEYLLGKTSEIRDLNTKDVLLAKVVIDIHRKRTHSDFVLVPLFSLKQIHAIDRENALIATEKRTKEIQRIKGQLLLQGNITREILAEFLPSISWIKVVKEGSNSYIAYEGNGRLVALQNVFSPSDNINIEVEEYYFKNPKKIITRMNKVRRLNGFS